MGKRLQYRIYRLFDPVRPRIDDGEPSFDNARAAAVMGILRTWPTPITVREGGEVEID